MQVQFSYLSSSNQYSIKFLLPNISIDSLFSNTCLKSPRSNTRQARMVSSLKSKLQYFNSYYQQLLSIKVSWFKATSFPGPPLSSQGHRCRPWYRLPQKWPFGCHFVLHKLSSADSLQTLLLSLKSNELNSIHPMPTDFMHNIPCR